jgi:hypothetical protein
MGIALTDILLLDKQQRGILEVRRVGERSQINYAFGGKINLKLFAWLQY